MLSQPLVVRQQHPELVNNWNSIRFVSLVQQLFQHEIQESVGGAEVTQRA